MQQNIFLVGPASVGKSTISKLLAEKLNFEFVDIDQVFCDRVALIPDYINENGYVAYCEQNSLLVDKLVVEHPKKTVFATPSGFLVHEDSPELVQKHLQLIDTNACSVLLLPSQDPLETADLVAKRQKHRWPEVDPANERQRYIARHAKYKNYGSIKIVGLFSPGETVNLITKLLS